MVWCGVVWCGVVWCGVVWCGVVWCGVVWCGACGGNHLSIQVCKCLLAHLLSYDVHYTLGNTINRKSQLVVFFHYFCLSVCVCV